MCRRLTEMVYQENLNIQQELNDIMIYSYNTIRKDPLTFRRVR